jgi:hypothetical protein
MAPAAIDLDVSKIESPILRFQEFRTLAAKPGFFAVCPANQRTTQTPNKTPLYVQYTPLFPYSLLFIPYTYFTPIYLGRVDR